MFGNFKNAISDVYEAKAAGDVEKLGASIQRLIELTQTYTKSFKNTDAVNHLNDLKNALEGVVPISEKVWKDLKLIYGGANGARGALSQAFGIKGWSFGGKSDVFTDNLPDWVIDKNEIHNETDAIQQLIEVMRNARAEAKIKTNIFDSGALTNSDIEKFINENYELIKVKQNQSQVDDNVIRKENEIVTSVKQSAQAFKDYQSVLSELNRLEESGMGKVLNFSPAEYLNSISSSTEAVDALGRTIERIKGMSSAADTENSLKNLINVLDEFKARTKDMSADQMKSQLGGLVEQLNSIGNVNTDGLKNITNNTNAAAESTKQNAQAIRDETAAIKEQSKAVQENSKSRTGSIDKSKSPWKINVGVDVNSLLKSINKAVRDINNNHSDEIVKVHISADENWLLKSINNAVRNINKNNSDSLTKIKISANEKGLQSSIRQAIVNINKSNSLAATPVKLSAAFKNVKQAVRDLQTQVSGQTVQVNLGAVQNSTVGNSISNANEKVTEELKNQAQAQNNIGQAAKAAAQALNTEAQTASSVQINVGNALNTVNRLLGDKQLFNSKSADPAKYQEISSTLNDAKNQLLKMQESLKGDNSVENVAKVKDEFNSVTIQNPEQKLTMVHQEQRDG